MKSGDHIPGDGPLLGMSLPDIRRYAQLARQGSGNEAERFEILRKHEAKV